VIAILAWLFDTTIKASLLIVLVACLQRAIGSRVDPRWRHLLWVVVLLRLLLPVTPTSPVSLFNFVEAPRPIAAARVVDMSTPPPHPARTSGSFAVFAAQDDTRERWWRMAFGVWLAGAVVFSLRTLIVALRMHRRVRHLDTSAFVVETDVVRTPALYGLLRPVLLLPRGLTESEVRHVVLHETWHLKRMDVAVSWLLAAAQIVHWFNPLVWFAASRIKEERELSCDELALSLLQEEERPDYGRTILKLLQRFAPAAPVPALVGMVNGKQKMKRRITMIASFRNRTRFTLLFLILVAAVGAAGLSDGQEGKQLRVMKKFDPAAAAMAERLDARLTFNLTNASFADFLGTVSSKAGVAVLQDPEIATLDVQKARFTIDAENIPAHAVLMEALIPFGLSAEPSGDGVTIVNRPSHRIKIRKGLPGDSAEVVIATNGSEKEVTRVIRKLETEEHDGTVDERVFVKKIGPHAEFDENGRLRREMKLNLEINGEKSTGRMTIEIQK
jgi:beta-lactamase regulating signal transducer with metallopeptidase domain